MNTTRQSINIIPGKPWMEVILIFLNDLVSFGIAIGLVTLVRYLFFSNGVENLFDPQAIRTIIYVVVFSLVMLALRGLYPGWGRPSVVELKQVSEAVILAYVVVAVFIFIQGANEAFSRSVFILSSIFAIVFMTIGRFLVRKKISKFPWWGEPVVVIGLESEIIEVSTRLLYCQRLGIRPVIGLAVDSDECKKYSKIPIMPWTLERQNAVHEAKIKTNILAITTSDLRTKYPQVFKSVGLNFQKTIFIVDNDIYSTMMAQPIDMNGQPAIVSRQSLLNPTVRLAKLIFEVLFICVLIIPIGLIGLILAIWIKLDSTGPVLYAQERIGRKRKPFRLFKFRTMVNNSDEVLVEMLKDPAIKEEWEKYHKIVNDPRITRAGNWIRRLSLDELPQFLNIIRGEMSLIGPRPYVQTEIDELGEAADLLLKVRPGLTGWWQVMGRNKFSFSERKNVDLYYVFNWSLWLDLFIFIKTFWVLVVDRDGK